MKTRLKQILSHCWNWNILHLSMKERRNGQNLISYRISITLNRGSCPLKMDKSQKSLKHFLNEKWKTNIQQKK